MDNFKVIYKILKLLEKYSGREDFEYEQISPSSMKISFERWEQLMIELQANGFIRGLVVNQTMSDKFPHIVEPIRPVITLKGMEYISENSFMARAKDALRMVGEIL